MKPILAVVQMTSTENPQHNYDICKNLVQEAAKYKAKMVAFPENFAFLGENGEQNKQIAQGLNEELFQSYCLLAKEHKIWISLGGFLEKSGQHIFNTHIIVDSAGQIQATYRKVHLFSLNMGPGRSHDEGKIISPGDQVVICKSPVGELGLSICYDLRFSGLYHALTRHGAEVILVPAAFTETTGKAHWEILLRARAIETQCYVAAPAQTGRHNSSRESHGHAMIIDPWGRMIAQCSEGTDITFASIDLDYLSLVRKRIPVSHHQRPDVYQKKAVHYGD